MAEGVKAREAKGAALQEETVSKTHYSASMSFGYVVQSSRNSAMHRYRDAEIASLLDDLVSMDTGSAVKFAVAGRTSRFLFSSGLESRRQLKRILVVSSFLVIRTFLMIRNFLNSSLPWSRARFSDLLFQ